MAGKRLRGTTRSSKGISSVARLLSEANDGRHGRQERMLNGIIPSTPSASSQSNLGWRGSSKSSSGKAQLPLLPSKPKPEVDMLGASFGVKRRQIHRIPVHKALPLRQEDDLDANFEHYESQAQAVLEKELPTDGLGNGKILEEFAHGAIIGPGSIFSFPTTGVSSPGLQPAPSPRKHRNVDGRRKSSSASVAESQLPIGQPDDPEMFHEASPDEDSVLPEMGLSHPAILPREPPRIDVMPGSVATMHASKTASSRLMAVSSQKSLQTTSSGTHGSTWTSWSSRALLTKPADRKWHLRHAPISVDLSHPRKKHSKLRTLSDLDESWAGSSLERKAEADGPRYLYFQGWGLDDDYSRALFSRADTSQLVTVNLSENRLTESAMQFLEKVCCQQPPLALESLHLAQNRLGPDGVRALARLFLGPLTGKGSPAKVQRFKLKELDLADNNMGDQACVDLCEALQICCRDLVGLSLARNKIGSDPKAGAAISSILATSNKIQALDLSWNCFHGSSIGPVYQGVYDNDIDIGGQLWRLSLAWNRLGQRCKPSRRSSSEECKCDSCRACSKAIATLASILHDGNALFHLDLSYNGLSAADCAVLGEALQSNHSLFGLHLSGNEAAVDDLGFVHRRAIQEVLEQETSEGQIQSMHDEEVRSGLDNYVRNLPRRLRLDRIGHFSEQHRAAPLLEQVSPLKLAYESSSPSLQRVEKSDVFSEVDVQAEKDWVKVHSKVQLPSCFDAKTEFEDVRINERCCWICENWVAQQVCYIPGVSGPEIHAEEVTEVFAFFSIDGFARPSRLTKTSDKLYKRTFNEMRKSEPIHQTAPEVPGMQRSQRAGTRASYPATDANGHFVTFKASRMLPPSYVRVQVIFQVNGKIACADHLPKVKLRESVKVRLHSDGRPNPHGALPLMPVALGSPGNEVDVTLVNEIDVGSDAWRLFEKGMANALCLMEDPRLRSGLEVFPRALQVDKKPKAWTFESSIFKDYSRDDPQAVKQCFEHDLGLTRLSTSWKRLAKATGTNPTAMKEYLASVYAQLLAAYTMESMKIFSEERGSYGLLMSGFSNLLVHKAEAEEPSLGSRSVKSAKSSGKWKTALLKSSVAGSISKSPKSDLTSRSNRGPVFNSGFPIAKADSYYVAASKVDEDSLAMKNMRGLPNKGLARFQFLDAVVKTALARFHDAGDLQPVDAVRKLVEELSLGSDFLYLRKTLHAALFSEECCLVLRNCRRLLNDAFNAYIKYKRLAGDLRNSHMSYGAWLDFMQACNAELMNEEVHKLAFILGKQICVEQHRNLEHMAMSWSEFLVGVAAAVRLGRKFEPASFSESLLNFISDHLPEAIEAAEQTEKAAALAAAGESILRHGKDPDLQLIVDIITEVFKEADDDGSGSLTLTEFSAALAKKHIVATFQELGLTLSDLTLLFHRLDSDNSGNITLQEFLDGLLKLRRAMSSLRGTMSFLRKAYLLIDTEMDGKISKRDFLEFAKQPAHLERFKSLGMNLVDLDDLWAAAKQVYPNDLTGDVTEQALIAGLIDLHQERGNVIRGLNFLNQLFMVADVDGSSSLTENEVKKYLCREEVTQKLVSLKLFVPDWLGVFGAIDANGDNEITWQELQTAMERMWSEAPADDREEDVDSEFSSEDMWSEDEGEKGKFGIMVLGATASAI
eukprot:CAMPEP_0197644852 /NCGR_PEP_ID=MMETSP1338-20131121/17692_1 /TAXON_ID=43686 ORGANISM="Pelagodinium beii, Strain RCC1491" /NCGR_SAMPLE_ID=MMETSP1338 /ASSEMBLY_ACC=CAM_ASM_000754 /LENGTH=1652 /DNA_ID=CAMNT_0043218317 /DNA_START=87 /DNA_END=5045 /DNA_ORIENTATION=+